MPVDPARVLVWQLGEALLAVDIDDVVEIAAVDDNGTARSREGAIDLVSVPGTHASGAPRRAVVVRAGSRLAALAADLVEGVAEPERPGETPPWLAPLPLRHIRGLLHLEERRIGALLALDALLPEP